MNLDEAIARSRALSGRLGYAAEVEGGRNVVVVRSFADLVAYNKPGNHAVVDPAVQALDTAGWTLPSSAFYLSSDFTLDAPGDNLDLVGGYFRPGSNCIVRGIGIRNAANDGIFADPAKNDYAWIDRCRIYGPTPDGALDVQSSAVTDATPARRFTFSRNVFYDCNKTMLLAAANVSEIKLYVTVAHNRFENCIQRCPRVSGGVMVDAHHNRFNGAPDMVCAMGITDGSTLVGAFNVFRGPAGQQAVQTLYTGGLPGHYIDAGGNDYGTLVVEDNVA